MMICGSGTDSEISLCGSIRPPLMYSSSLTTTSSPRTLTFSMRAFTRHTHLTTYPWRKTVCWIKCWDISGWEGEAISPVNHTGHGSDPSVERCSTAEAFLCKMGNLTPPVTPKPRNQSAPKSVLVGDYIRRSLATCTILSRWDKWFHFCALILVVSTLTLW